jgi:Neurotransmitter-gated ion-channel ligand binding domain
MDATIKKTLFIVLLLYNIMAFADDGLKRVSIDVVLHNITNVSSQINEHPTATVDISLSLKWQDKAQAKKHITQILSGSKAIKFIDDNWTPDIKLKNSINESVKSRLVRVYHDGMISLTKQMLVTIPVNFDLKQFPFDSQVIKLIFEGRRESMSPLYLTKKLTSYNSHHHIKMTQWEDLEVLTRVNNSDINSSQPSSYTYTIFLNRIPGYYVTRIIAPLFLIIIISWFSFLMYGEDASTRLSRSIFLLLTIVAFHKVITNYLPKINYVTLIDALVFLSYVFMLVLIILSVIIHQFTRKGNLQIALKIDKLSIIYVPALFINILIAIILYYL